MKLPLNQALRGSLGKAWIPAIPILAYTAGRREHDDFVPQVATQTAMLGISIGSFAAASAIHPTLGAVVGAASLLGLAPSERVERKIFHGIREFTQFGRKLHRIETGGDYQDTITAARQRERAIREITGALAPARRLLGREAAFLHE